MSKSFLWTVLAAILGSGVGGALVGVGWEIYRDSIPENSIKEELVLRHLSLSPIFYRDRPNTILAVKSSVESYNKAVYKQFSEFDTQQLIKLYATYIIDEELELANRLVLASEELSTLISRLRILEAKDEEGEYPQNDIYYCFGQLRSYFGISNKPVCEGVEHLECTIK